jgi:colanic acid/amylovoran biosynthesis glycosyltransferase
LPQTQTWIYGQVRHVPVEIVENWIVCGKTENLDQFGLSNIHSVVDSGLPFAGLHDRLPLRGLRRLWLLDRTARAFEPHIVYSHFGNQGWSDSLVVRRLPVRQLVRFYGADLSLLPRRERKWLSRYRRLFERADVFLCEGPHMATCLADLGCPKEKIRVHHLGVAVGEITLAPRSWDRTEPYRVLLAGSFREKKGIPFAIEALGRLKDRVSLEITLIGDASAEPTDQLEKQKIMAAIQRHDLGSRIRLLGYQPYRALLEEALKHHLFLAPSVTASDGDTEGGAPVTLIEMSATGMPVVSTTHCDIPNVILDGTSGLLAPERDVDGLVERIGWLIDNPEKWKEMGEAGRLHVQTEFDAHRQGERLTQIYASMLPSTGITP